MKALALLLAALLFAACSADNTTTTDAPETTTEIQENDDQTQKRSALAGIPDYGQDLDDIPPQRQYPYPGNTGQDSYGGNYNNPNYGHHGSSHGYENVIPGTAVRDYPIYAHPPITRFSCKGLPAGLYADIESRCQAWHICQDDGRHDRFLCANGTLFNQKFLVCDWWYNVECGRSGQYVGGSPYPPYQPKPIYPTNPYNPSFPKNPQPQQPYYPPKPVPKPTQKPYYPTQLPQQPYPPQVPQSPYYPPQVPQQPFPAKVPPQPFPPQIPQQPFPPQFPQQPYPPHVPQQPYPPQGPRPSYPQGPHITFPGPYIPRGDEGNYYPADIGNGAINRNSGIRNANSQTSFPLYKAAPSTKTISTADFPTNRKIADKDNNQEDFEPVQY